MSFLGNTCLVSNLLLHLTVSSQPSSEPHSYFFSIELGEANAQFIFLKASLDVENLSIGIYANNFSDKGILGRNNNILLIFWRSKQHH